MSKIKLFCPVYYSVDDNGMPKERELVINGIAELFPELRFPVGGLTFFYGNNKNGREAEYELARELDKRTQTVELHVEVGTQHKHKVDLTQASASGIGLTHFLDVTRAKKDVLDALSKMSVQELGGTIAGQEDWPRRVTAHPYQLDAVIKDGRFKHLAVIAYTVNTKSYGAVKVATLFDSSKATNVDGGHSLINVDLVLEE